jgi:CSLREA domain-containing protein
MKPNLPTALLAGLLIAPAQGATITVTSLADNTALDGQVTLREAILAANTNTSVDGSAAGSGADEIVFATTPGTILLGGAALPLVTEALTITGSGAARLAIDGAGTSRLLAVPADVQVAVSGLTLRNGRAVGDHGGAILNAGTLTVTRAVLSGNAATVDGGAIWNGGALTVDECVFSGNSAQGGGGILNQGSLQVSGTTFRGNFTGGIAPFVGAGGGLFTSTSATITASTFSSNHANNGGGIASNGTVTLANSTLTDNTALRNGGGLSFSSGGVSLTVSGSTVTGNRADVDQDGVGNGGGINGITGSILIHTTIVAENFRGATSQDVAATVLADSFDNVVGVDTGLVGMSHGTNGNRIGTSGSPLAPGLGPLQDNGGPTPTRAVLPGSPALDRGLVTCPVRDQRGIARPLDGDHDTVAACDAGAYEAFTILPGGAAFYTVPPCRVADTRGPAGPSGRPALEANSSRFFSGAGSCGIPADARAVAFNVTVVNETDAGYLRLYPAGTAAPAASTINFMADRVRANNAVLPLGAGGQVAVRCEMAPGSPGTTHLVLDVYGYFK